MDSKVVGLVGAIAGLASADPTQAATAPGTPPELPQARSYAELLDPIPNALALLRELDAAEQAAPKSVPDVQLAGGHHHHHRWRHHHHHHHRWWRHHHHHHHHRWWRHHHHHHHHHSRA